jgi:3-hydroxybutyryl-CoA dehydrogenase
MGSGIAEVAALAGADVIVAEVDEDMAARGRVRLSTSLDKGVERGKIEGPARDGALERIAFTTDLGAMADRSIVIEAVIEDEAAKLEVFRRLDSIVESAEAVLASNTSSIPIMKLAMATGRPEAIVGLHFFNPVPVMRLVEVVPSLLTSEATLERAATFARDVLGKDVVRAPDRAGFIVNALLVPYLLDAIRFYEAGRASAADIDTAMRFGANHPMGPLALCDLIGNDTMLHIAESLFGELHEARLAPPPVLRRMVEAGLLGRKSGRGFYSYG